MRFVRKYGEILVATRLRQLSLLFWEKRLQIYQENGVKFRPNWGTIVAIIQDNPNCTINDIASELGFAHTSVLKIVKDMTAENYIISTQDKNDGRRKIISLTKLGMEEHKKLDDLSKIVELVNKEILKNSGLMNAIQKVEAKFDEESYYERFNRVLNDNKENTGHVSILR